MTTPSIPNIIAPLIRRHSEDAAFYWGLIDASINAPRLSFDTVARFADMLDAHLEGLRVAGPEGWGPCLAALERWRKPADAFVCAHQAFTLGDAAAIDAMLAQIRPRPDELLRGVISAIAWQAPAQAGLIIRQWTGSHSEIIQQVAAIRAAALVDTAAAELLGQPFEHFLDNPDSHVRAAACRLAATVPPGSAPDVALSRCLSDCAVTVRAEASIALHALGRQAAEVDEEKGIDLANTLWQCVVGQVTVANESTGWYRLQAVRRLQRWVRNLATMVPLGHDKVSALLDFMPARISLRFIACHGDPAYLPYAIARMAHPDTCRYAGWAWETMTGIDLESAALSLPEPPLGPEDDGISDARVDADHDLPLPDMGAIARYPTHLAPGQRTLAGQALTPMFAVTLLETAPQATRSLACQFLQLYYPQLKLSPRAQIGVQRVAIDRLRRLLVERAMR